MRQSRPAQWCAPCPRCAARRPATYNPHACSADTFGAAMPLPRHPMNVLFEDDGQLKAGTVLADQDASLQVEAASGKRLKVKAGNVLLALRRRPSPADAAGRGRPACGRARSDVPVGGRARTASSASPISRASTTARTPTPAQAAAVAHAAARLADALLQEGQGTLSQGAGGLAEGRAGVASSARRAKPSRSRHGSHELAGRRAARGVARQAADAALPARQEHARVEGAGRRVRGAQDESGRAARRVRRDPVDARLSLQRASWSRRFRRASAFPPWGALPAAAASCRSSDGARVLDRRRIPPPRSTTRSRCASSPTATTRSASTSRAPALAIARDSAARPHRARAAVDGVHAGAQAHDAARGGRRRVHAARRGTHAAACSRCAMETDARRRAACATSRASSASPSPRTCASTQSPTPSPTTLPSPPDPPWTAELRVLWKLVTHARRRARQDRLQAHRLQLLRRLGARARDGARGDRPARARLARSTSSSPS